MSEKLIEIGKSGIMTPFLGMGTWAIGGGAWWGDNDDQISIRTIEEAIDAGILWFDTAPVYGLGHSEKVVGKALKGKRHKVILSSKCGLQWDYETPAYHKSVDGVKVYRDLSGKALEKQVEQSLIRLQTDYLDVCYTHWQTPDPKLYPIEETMDTLMKLKKQGKIRAIGASNVTEDIIREYCRCGQLDVIQEKYSLFTRRIEKELVPVCQELGVSIQAYSPLEQGLLTGKASEDRILPEGDVRNNNPWWKPEPRKRIIAMLKGWNDLENKYECSIGNLVIALTAELIPNLHILCGARRPDQIEDNVRAVKLALEKEDVIRMKEDVNRIGMEYK